MLNHPSNFSSGDQTLASTDMNKGFFAGIKSSAKYPVFRVITIIGVCAVITSCYYPYRKNSDPAEPNLKTAKGKISGSSSSYASSNS